MAGNTILSKPYTCAAAIGASRFVAHGATDGSAVVSGVGGKIMGISNTIGGGAPGTTQISNGGPVPGRVDVDKVGGSSLILGATVARGDLLKSDANGAGIPVSAVGDNYGAQAEQSGVIGDVIDVTITIGIR
ncbi:MAG TPA: hypothetical protein PKY05_03340 [Fibrobacteria bacterium]|nr:hypothetical protein [Fibrobacteria bacterium]